MKNLKLNKPIAVFDLETTGKDPRTDRIVEISITRIEPNGDRDSKTRRINPTIPIPPEATAIHGISDEDVKDKPTFFQVARSLANWIDKCDLCGYNVKNYDLPLIANEFNRAGVLFEAAGRSIIDPMEIFKLKEPRHLDAATRFYLGRPHEGAHGAEADVSACIAVLEAQIIRYGDLPRIADDLAKMFAKEEMVDIDGFFCHTPDGIAFARGKHKGVLVVKCDPTYLQWMLDRDFLPDTKAVAITVLKDKKLLA